MQEAGKLQNERSALQTIKELWIYLWPHNRYDLKIRIVIALLCMVFAKIVLLCVPYLYKATVNSLAPQKISFIYYNQKILWLSTPIIFVFIYNVARLLQNALNQIRDSIFASVGQHAVRTLALKSFVHIHKLSLRFHTSRRTGVLSSVIERAVKSIETIIRFALLNSVPTIAEFIFAAIAFWYSCGFSYLIIVLIVFVVYIWFTVITSNKRINIRRSMNLADTRTHSRSVDALLNYETVKYFNNEEMEAARFNETMKLYEKSAIKMWTSLGWLNFGQGLILAVGMFIIMAMSAHSILLGKQTLGDFVFVNALLIQLSFPLNFIGSVYREIRQGLTDVEAMFNLLSVKPEVVDAIDAKEIKIKEANIIFENVSFTYENNRKILDNISFTVENGKTVAIVGSTGAGKSTILRLLYRFYEPTSGKIYIDNQDITKIQSESLRRTIAVVPQDTVLFNETIEYNIVYGKLSATKEEIIEAAKSAQIHKFIEKMPLGYETIVGERGLKLSGGEKQRIAIARAILKNPKILMLDEATSALDTNTERHIQIALDKLSEKCTTIIIAHRLSTVKKADQILVLNEGQIAERGNHYELLAHKGIYATMWEKQKEVQKAHETIEKNET